MVSRALVSEGTEHLSGLTLYFPGVLVKTKDISQTKFKNSLSTFLYLPILITPEKKMICDTTLE